MKGTMCFLLAAVLAVGFFGCSENPAGPTDSINLSVPMFALQDSWQLNDSVWTYELVLASRAFYPAVEDSASLLGMRVDGADLTNWRLGVIGRERDGAWIFRVSTKNADKRINFVRGSNWVRVDSLKKISFFEPSDSSGHGNLAIHFESGRIFSVSGHDTLYIIRTVITVIRDTLPGKIIYDTLKITNHDTVHVRDTVFYALHAFIPIDKGRVIDTSKSFLRDTVWLDADFLKGIITEDTIVSTRIVHTVWLISAAGDTTIVRDTTLAPVQVYRYRADTTSFVLAQYGASIVQSETVYRFGITVKAFAYSGRNDDSVSLTGLDTSKWTFVGKIGGYFVLDAKLAKGTTYHFNFVGNKGTWAKQEILLLSPLAVKIGANCDIVCKVDGTGLVKP